MYRTIISSIHLVCRLICIFSLMLSFPPAPALAAGSCGTGTWAAGTLEIHHINIGQGDATLIVSPTGKSLLFDAGESYWNSSADARVIGPYIEAVLGCKTLDYAVISHFHVDHIGYVGYGGLWHLVEAQGFTVGSTLVRNYNVYLGDVSSTFTNWRNYLEGAGQAKLHPVTAIEGMGLVNLGTGVTFDIVAVDGHGSILAGDFHEDSNPPSENDYSIGAVLSYGAFDEWIGGDLDGQYEVGGFGYTNHDIELNTASEVGDVDIYKVNHHGSSHSSSATFINQLDPEVSIVTVGSGNTYGHPTQPIMDRLLATSAVYMTEHGNPNTDIGSAIVAGSIVIKTSNGTTYTVNGTQYTATEPTRIDADGDGYFVEADPNDGSSSILPSPNGGCGPIYQTCSASLSACQVIAGQVLINEVFPSPADNGTEWVELYNATSSEVNIGDCILDDIAGGSPPHQIPASTVIPAHGFWSLDRNSYFNNAGDDVRFLKEDGITVLDSYTYGNTATDLTRYRLPDGGPWATAATASPTKGQTNTLSFYPIVLTSVRADPNPTDANSVNFTVTFSKAVTGVNTVAPFADFTLTTFGVSGAYISAVSGSGLTYTVTVNTGAADGTIRLNVQDDDSIRDSVNKPLGGIGAGNGSYTAGQTYTIDKDATFADVPADHMFWKYIEAFYNAGITTGCSQNPRMFCPYNNVTRAEMAVFLERAIGNFSSNPSPTGMFADVPGTFWASKFIDQFYNDSLTTGCTPASVTPKLYCPNNNVTRAEMAVFVERATGNFTPTPSPSGMFADVLPDHWAAKFIDQFYNDGITTGCAVGPLRYCPNNNVTRQEMAVFIVRAFHIPLP